MSTAEPQTAPNSFTPASTGPFGLYVHVPFCSHKCPYCDFNTYAVKEVPEVAYSEAIIREMETAAKSSCWKKRSVGTVFFGGGTPSLLKPSTIRTILTRLDSLFRLDDQLEVSLEANPGELTEEQLAGYLDCGVSRLSLGAQSFNQATLKSLGRTHQPHHTESAVRMARRVGFLNISLDIMFGAPEQKLADVVRDLEEATALDPAHLSIYGLTIENGTPFASSFAKGKLPVPNGELAAQMLEVVIKYLPQLGYNRYEISNFCQPGFEAKHNVSYWESRDYLGLGAGAHSMCARTLSTGEPAPVRWSNVAKPTDYQAKTEGKGSPVAWRDELSLASAIFDFVYLGLRQSKGLAFSTFANRFKQDFKAIYKEEIDSLLGDGLISLTPERLALTGRGMMVADSVIGEFSEPTVSHLGRMTAEPVRSPSKDFLANPVVE